MGTRRRGREPTLLTSECRRSCALATRGHAPRQRPPPLPPMRGARLCQELTRPPRRARAATARAGPARPWRGRRASDVGPELRTGPLQPALHQGHPHRVRPWQARAPGHVRLVLPDPQPPEQMRGSPPFRRLASLSPRELRRGISPPALIFRAFRPAAASQARLSAPRRCQGHLPQGSRQRPRSCGDPGQRRRAPSHAAARAHSPSAGTARRARLRHRSGRTSSRLLP
mmetsp:Transcript_3522/g.10112  ORF Transcript_3522/g.10112 Transcript_3522/m.10112 type:complete len:228 (-) Transcript_3522:220-903(-)